MREGSAIWWPRSGTRTAGHSRCFSSSWWTPECTGERWTTQSRMPRARRCARRLRLPATLHRRRATSGTRPEPTWLPWPSLWRPFLRRGRGSSPSCRARYRRCSTASRPGCTAPRCWTSPTASGPSRAPRPSARSWRCGRASSRWPPTSRPSPPTSRTRWCGWCTSARGWRGWESRSAMPRSCSPPCWISPTCRTRWTPACWCPSSPSTSTPCPRPSTRPGGRSASILATPSWPSGTPPTNWRTMSRRPATRRWPSRRDLRSSARAGRRGGCLRSMPGSASAPARSSMATLGQRHEWSGAWSGTRSTSRQDLKP
mmetsp:Transcript_71720/g.191350  ORF Transcript_71720/g.191350 Transcript_71720/m.191350 type:complete len:314 (+) Transcript_71720:1444-2385(+)